MHPLEGAGVGHAPYAFLAMIRFPAEASGIDQARRYRVPPGRCACCKLPADDLIVIVGADNKNAAVCRPCLFWANDGGLIRRLRREDHERRRLLNSLDPAYHRPTSHKQPVRA